MEAALSAIGWLMVAATVLPLIRSDLWIVRIFDFPRLQITLVFAAVLAAYLWIREDPGLADQLLLGLMSLCLLYQSWRMWPYTPLHPRQVKSAASDVRPRSLSVLISNILMTNRDSSKIRELIREHDPDLVLIVEADDWWQTALRELEQSYPQVLRQPQANTYGMLLYSRRPWIAARTRFLVKDDVPSFDVELKLESGDQVMLRCLHPRPPAPSQSRYSTQRDVELLLTAEELRGRDQPSIVVGDLNDVAWSRTNDLFQKISGLLDPRVGRGFYSTFNAKWPFIRFPLDHAFISRHFHLADFKVLPSVNSDHFPVYVRLVLAPPTSREENRTPESPTAEERHEVREKISE